MGLRNRFIFLKFQIFCSCVFFLSFQYTAIAGGGSYVGIANTSIALTGTWSIQQNQAGIANEKNVSAGASYENRFLLPELGLKSFAVIVPIKGNGVFGFDITHFGYHLYNEKKIGLTYARMFGDKLSAGIQFDYLSTFIAEAYGRKNTVTIEAGMQIKIFPNTLLGVHIYNPSRTKLSDYNNERIPTIMRVGLAQTFSDKVIACVEIEKNMELKPSVKAGIEYHIIQSLFLRTGISADTGTSTFGVGLLVKQLRIDFASSVHPILGISPHVALTYAFK